MQIQKLEQQAIKLSSSKEARRKTISSTWYTVEAANPTRARPGSCVCRTMASVAPRRECCVYVGVWTVAKMIYEQADVPDVFWHVSKVGQFWVWFWQSGCGQANNKYVQVVCVCGPGYWSKQSYYLFS